MTPKEFVAKHAKKLPPDPCYGIEPTNEDELLADFHAAVESMLPTKIEFIEKLVENTDGTLSDFDFYAWLRTRILDSIEQSLREK